ncbi:MAG: hypothetical protein U0132_24235 [Gemmatimonadaceae bacterium]
MAPNQPWQGNRLFAYHVSCGAFAIWDLLPPPPGDLFHAPTGIEINGRGELLAAVIEPNDTRVFYNFGFTGLGLQTFTAAVATAPGEFDGDIAIGSDF